MITLTQLRALLALALTHTKNPAIMRLTGLTMEGLVLAYLPRAMAIQGDAWTEGHYAYQRALLVTYSHLCALDLTDPGSAHALMVALALALGLDPGVGGVGCFWCFMDDASYRLGTLAGDVYFTQFEWINDGEHHRFAPTVAAEPDPIKALGLAVLHVLPATSSTG